MISPGKLSSLPERNRKRKYVLLLRKWEDDLLQNRQPVPEQLFPYLEPLKQESFLNQSVSEYCNEFIQALKPFQKEKAIFAINRLRYALLSELGISPADWDFQNIADRYELPDYNDDTDFRKPCYLYLDGIRSPFNLGSLFRTAEAFGLSGIFLSDDTVDPDHPRCLRTAMGAVSQIPWKRVKSVTETGIEPVFALELGGTNIGEFIFPSHGIVILGNEELGVSPECLDAAVKSSGLVSIPMPGKKASLNVSVSTGVLLFEWISAIGKK